MTPTAGIGFKADHFADALTTPAVGLWFEVHAENYMVAGGPRLAMLDRLRRDFPISLHGVGLSLAGAGLPDPVHLAALKRLADRVSPAMVSEHLAWSRLDGRCFPDLLPVPRSARALDQICANIDCVQDALGRSILIENPSHYLSLVGHEWSEADFLIEITLRTGCGLLIDVNNVVVSAYNLGFDPVAWFNAIPAHLIGEIHLGGHSRDANCDLLIDSHDAPVAESVWQLFDGLVAAIGPRPTLIERDGNLPPYAMLLAERDRADRTLTGVFEHV